MSLVQRLIKKAFVTTNVNEAASFLASACNRMKLQSKDQIMQEVSAALVSINLTKSDAQSSSSMLYQDSPETLQRLQAAEARAASLLSQLREEQQKNKPPQTIHCDTPETISRLRTFENQVTELKKALKISQEMHLRESALVRSVMQREIDKLQSDFNRHKLTAQTNANRHHRETSEYHQNLTAADALIKTLHEGRLRAETEAMLLDEKLQQLQKKHHYDVEQHTDLYIQLTKTIDELSASRNTLSSYIDLLPVNK